MAARAAIVVLMVFSAYGHNRQDRVLTPMWICLSIFSHSLDVSLSASWSFGVNVSEKAYLMPEWMIPCEFIVWPCPRLSLSRSMAV